MASTNPKPLTKSDKVKQLLSRGKGATLGEICNVTNWKPHSARAFLTSLRKKGVELTKEQRGDAGTTYRIIALASGLSAGDPPHAGLS